MRKKLFWLFAILIILLGIYFCHPYILKGMARFLIVQDKIEPSELIIVLAGDNNGERVNEAVKLYKQGYAKKILMSGGPMVWNFTYAEWMKKQAQAMGVPSRAILLEDKSRSTLENAQFSLPTLKKHEVKFFILVTSPTHTRRAKRVFGRICAREGIKVLCYPVQEAEFRVSKWWTRHEDTQRVVREYMSLVYYFLKGY